MAKGGLFTQKRATAGYSHDQGKAGYKKNKQADKNNAYGMDNDKNRGSG